MDQPLLVAAVTAPSMAELRNRRDVASTIADLVELRLDSVDRPDVAAALAGRRGPVIVTCRPAWEGGGYVGPEGERLALLQEAVRLGAEYVDVEWRADHGPIVAGRGGTGVVLSYHDFVDVPSDLSHLYREMKGTGAQVVKLAVTARRLGDCVRLRELAAAGRPDPGTVLIAMGPGGLPTRIRPASFGSCWGYAGDGVAPGQIPAERLLHEFRFRDAGVDADLYGVVGRPVGHSVSPAMHNAAFRARGVRAVYLPLEAADADDFLAFAGAVGLKGASVTAPFKLDLLRCARTVDPLSRRLHAVNTLRLGDDGTWEGANTDVAGFLAPLRGVRLEGRRAAVLGSGGAARAVVVALADEGARVTVYGRDAERAREVAALCGAEARGGTPSAGTWDLLVNATPVGTYPDDDRTPIPSSAVAGGQTVYDLVYNPARTRLLREAATAGCRTIEGLEMLVAQGARQFEWWTGLDAPANLMHEEAAARLASQGAAR